MIQCAFYWLLLMTTLLPTVMRTVGEVPDWTTRLGCTLCSLGVIRPANPFLRVEAARTNGGQDSDLRDRRDSAVSVDSTLTSTPSANPVAITKSFPKSFTVIPITGGGVGFTLFHPASCNAASTCLSKFRESLSEPISENVYSVPANGRNASASMEAFVSNLGAFIRFSSSCAADACLRASARCRSASTACSFADFTSPLSASASLRAPVARFLASPASLLACVASPAALCADASALPAASRVSANNCWLMLWMFSSSEFTLPSTQNSPATPTATKIQPTNPMSVIQLGACSLASFLNHLFMTLISSNTSSGPSKITPQATSFVINKRSEKSWLRAVCHPSLESSNFLIASGLNSAKYEVMRTEEDNRRMKSFNKQMCALAIVFIIVISWRIAAECRRK
jgi:hypothetical protein